MRVLISGGGIAGPALAFWLHRAGAGSPSWRGAGAAARAGRRSTCAGWPARWSSGWA